MSDLSPTSMVYDTVPVETLITKEHVVATAVRNADAFFPLGLNATACAACRQR